MATFDEAMQEIEAMKRKAEMLKRKGQQAEGQKKALIGEIQHIYDLLKTEVGMILTMPDPEDEEFHQKLAKNNEKIMEYQRETAKKITEAKNQMAAILRELGENV